MLGIPRKIPEGRKRLTGVRHGFLALCIVG